MATRTAARGSAWRGYVLGRAFILGSLVLLLAGCKGEDRPNVEVIGGGGQTGSVSASGPGPAPIAAALAGGGRYAPVSNVDLYFQMGLDRRDMRALMAPGAGVGWSAVLDIYANGKNQVRAGGAVRSLASIPDDSVQAVFPDGARVYGRPNFIDALIRDGLAGTGRAQGLTDAARAQIVDKGVQMMMYGKALQELAAARSRIVQNNLDNATGAPHAVDEAFAAIAGLGEGNSYPHGLLQTAIGREADFKLEGKLRDSLEAAFVAALSAAQAGNLPAFDAAASSARGYLNAIFYLGALRYPKVLEADTTEAQREAHMAEGWAFWQAIRAAVAGASPSAAQTVESAFTRRTDQAFPASETTRVYAALNEAAVLAALAIPAAVQVKSPPSP